MNRIIYLLFFSSILISCTIAEKGAYPTVAIDRPYGMTKDVAKSNFGLSYVKDELDDASRSATGSAESDSGTLPKLFFENGITDNFTWIYPIGARYQFYNDDKHILGATGYTLLFYTATSLDYWYRINERWSVRPFFETRTVDLLIFYSEKIRLGGLKFMFQANEKWSISPSYANGSYRSKSELIELILDGSVSSDKDTFTEAKGDMTRWKIEALYSVNDRWDIVSEFSLESIDFDAGATYNEFSFSRTSFLLGANYFW